MASHPEKEPSHGADHPPEKGHGPEKKNAAGKPEAESKVPKGAVDATRSRTSETLRAHENNPEDRAEKLPLREAAEDAKSEAEDRAVAARLYEEAEVINKKHRYTTGHGVVGAASRTALAGAGVLLASSIPEIWSKMMSVKAPVFADGTAKALSYPGWVPAQAVSIVNAGIPLLGGVLGAYGGSLAGGHIGRKVAKYTGLTDNQGYYIGKSIGMGVGGVGSYAGANWLVQNGLSRLWTMAIPNFSTLYAIPGALVGAWGGGVLGEWIGEHVFNNPGAGKWIGRIAGGVGCGWAAGAAGGTMITMWPGAVVAGVLGAGAWSTGRILQNVLGWERKGIVGTMFDAPRGVLEGGTRIVSWLANKVTSPLRGLGKAIEDKPRTGVGEKFGGLVTDVALAPGRAFGRVMDGIRSSFGYAPKDMQKDQFPTKFGDAVGNAIQAPFRGVKKGWNWLWQDTGGKGGHVGH